MEYRVVKSLVVDVTANGDSDVWTDRSVCTIPRNTRHLWVEQTASKQPWSRMLLIGKRSETHSKWPGKVGFL